MISFFQSCCRTATAAHNRVNRCNWLLHNSTDQRVHERDLTDWCTSVTQEKKKKKKKKVGSREREEQGREFSLWPNVLFHPGIPWSPSSPHVVRPACALACAKARARGRSARTPAADDVFSGRGYISSLPSAALNSFHVGRFSACARPTQRSSASCFNAHTRRASTAAAGSFWGREAGVPPHQSWGDYFANAFGYSYSYSEVTLLKM